MFESAATTPTLPLLANHTTPSTHGADRPPPPPPPPDDADADDRHDDGSADANNDGAAAQEHLDSLNMLARASTSMSAQQAAQLHMYAVVTCLIVYSHYYKACGAGLYDARDAQAALDAEMSSWSLHFLTLFPALCVVAGVEDRRHGWAWPRLRHGLLLNAALVWLLRFSSLPATATSLQLRFWRLGPWFDGGELMAEPLQREKLAAFQCAQISWWPVTLSCWRIVGHVGARRLRLPPWLLPACAVVLHFAKGWAQRDGQPLLAPVAAVGLRADYWVFYAAVPHFVLPRRFPLDLPFGTWLQRRAVAVRERLTRREDGAFGGGGSATPSHPPRCVVHAPRVFWVVVATACYAAGSHVGRCDEHHRNHHHHQQLHHHHQSSGGGGSGGGDGQWDGAPLLRLYADAARSGTHGGGGGVAASPAYHLLMLDTPPRRHAYGAFPGLRAHVHRVGAAAAARHLVTLHAASLAYACVLVVALAAIVPRRRVIGLTTAGAGSLAVYATQGFLAPPLLLGPTRQAMIRWLHAPMHVAANPANAGATAAAAGVAGGGEGGSATAASVTPDAAARTNAAITWLVLAQCLLYTVSVASAAAVVAGCCTTQRGGQGGGGASAIRRCACAALRPMVGVALVAVLMVAVVQRGLPGGEASP